jgi:hypothetical protein
MGIFDPNHEQQLDLSKTKRDGCEYSFPLWQVFVLQGILSFPRNSIIYSGALSALAQPSDASVISSPHGPM